MSNDAIRALYEVPALDRDGQPVTLRMRPECALVTVETIHPDGTSLAQFGISITHTGRFASFFGACVHDAATWGMPTAASGETPTDGVS